MPGLRRCAVIGKETSISPTGSSIYYGFGTPTDNQPINARFTAEEIGYVDRQVRCINCKFVNIKKSHCKLYKLLNTLASWIFDLDYKIDLFGCCNFQTPK